GAKNAILVIMTALILTEGKSILDNVPNNADVRLMIVLLEQLGAVVSFDTKAKCLIVDTTHINKSEVHPEIMNKIRASILVMGPLLARFGTASVAMPGGDLIGMRPINYHLEGFKKLGVEVQLQPPFVSARVSSRALPSHTRIVLDYPSVGATENIMMLAVLSNTETTIVNAALEPEVYDLIDVLKKMGANISIAPAMIIIRGVSKLLPIVHSIIPDRLEAGTLLLAAAITGGSITIPNARADHLDIFIEKLRAMGHSVTTGFDSPAFSPVGISLQATKTPAAISIKTAPYPGFPTDLQPLIMAALCTAQGISTVEETVYENRMMHTKELSKMGAQITVEGTTATIRGVDTLYGSNVIAADLRASCTLVLAGLVAEGETKISGVNHWLRGYDGLDEKLNSMGASILLTDDSFIGQDDQKHTQISL
ncbi:UDP-N-acetylglucosamine 1-carboxyvinyltransferase, partial [Candidatus Dependentiae bacterium]|nr:UDP-N-acetylglucosamine 1-carboxyvinyltransferase [Candidatus Dependentiae bacterium]